MQEAPFQIGQFGVSVTGDPAPWRERFKRDCAFSFSGAFAPEYLAKLLERAAQSQFADDFVDQIGWRAIESPQRVGKALSLLLHSAPLLHWLVEATGSAPLRAVAGRLVETRANQKDALGWHDDRDDSTRQLAVVINLSDRPFGGGQFQLRRKGDELPFLTFDHPEPGSMLVFAVRPELEHQVTLVTDGGPRRVYAGWFLTRPEFEDRVLGS